MTDFALQIGESAATWLARLVAVDPAALGGWDRVSLNNHLDSARRRAERPSKEAAGQATLDPKQTPLEYVKALCGKLTAEERLGLREWLQTNADC